MIYEKEEPLSVTLTVLQDTAVSAKTLQKELNILSRSFSALGDSIVQAATPIAITFLPIINQGVQGVNRLISALGKVISVLFLGGSATENLDKKTKSATTSQKALGTAAKTVKRTLAGFDQITRLGSVTGGGGSASSVSKAEVLPTTVQDTLSPQLQRIVDKILYLIAPLKEIDFKPAVEAFNRLRLAIDPIGRELFSGLEWAWFHLLVPLANWTISQLLPAFLDLVSAGLRVLNQVIIALKPTATWLWESFLKPLAQWTGSKIIETLNNLQIRLTGISEWVSKNQELVQHFGVIIGVVAAAFLLLRDGTDSWGSALNGIDAPIMMTGQLVAALMGSVVALNTGWGDLESLWGGTYNRVKGNLINPLTSGFRSMANGIIGFLNGIIRGVVQAVNMVVQAVNRLKFTIPSWVPGLGGRSLGFQLKTITAPQIPYLAQGAVLPANRPFLAMVGDQRYGTNVEAPLTTIQEAVANVLDRQNQGMQAALAASLGVQQEILEAVLGIRIGDEVIGQATARYQRKLSMMKGV